MRSYRGILLTGFLLAHASAGGAGESPQDLMRQLGNPNFQRRVDAERRLLELGSAGIEAASLGAHSSDPEIRERSLRLMVTLQRMAFQERREEIRLNPWTAPSDLTPGWEFYHQLVGDGATARDLYVSMVDQEADLMLAVVRRPDAWPTEFERRCAELRSVLDRRANRGLEPASVAALIFLAMHPDNTPSPLSAGLLGQLINDSRFSRELRGEAGQPLQSLLSHWIGHGPHATAQSRLTLAITFQLPAGATAAREIVSNRNAQGAGRPLLQPAIQFLAKFGDAEDFAQLEELLDDETPLSNRGRREGGVPQSVDLQVSDVALLSLLQATNQDPASYGFSNIRTITSYGSQYLTATFPSAEQRRDALLKWKAWRSRHLSGRPVSEWDASEGTLL